MVESIVRDDCLTIRSKERSFVLHSKEAPLLSAVKREKTYETSRGTVKETVVESKRSTLSAVSLSEEGEILFMSDDHCVKAVFEELPDGFTLHFTGEEGWSYEFSIPAVEGESVFGGGEQYRKVNLRGETVVNFVSEHIKAETVLQKAFLPKALYHEKEFKDIGTYAPMPVFVTDKKRMILFRTPSDGISVFGKDVYRFTFDHCPDSLTIVQKHTFRELAAALNALLPNKEYLPDWCYDGMILGVQGGTKTVVDKAFHMLDEGAKICGVWCQDWSGENRTVMGKQVYWNWEADETLYPDLPGAIKQLNGRGVKFLGYINPYLVKDSRLYNECKEKKYLILHEDGTVYHIKSTTFDAGMLDLTNPEVVRFIKEKLIRDNMLYIGISGWMADFGEYLPVDCVLHDGDPKQLHNVWPVLWAKLNREAIEEFGKGDEFFFSRSGYLGIAEYAPILWNGDQHTDVTKDYGMPCVMPASFSLGFSGVTLVHSDVGGFFTFGKLKRSPELFIRWMEMNTFSMLMRSHESLRPWANAQYDDVKVTPYTVKLTNIHAALKRYLQQLEEEGRHGIPAMRPDFYESGEFQKSHDPYSYFLGDDLFVAPVIEMKAKTRTVFLPEGDWVGFFDEKPYSGNAEYIVDAPLGCPPVFYRKESAFADVFRRAAAAK